MDAFLLRLVAETSKKPNALVLILSAIVLVLCAVRLIRLDPRIRNFVKSQRISGQRGVAKTRRRGVAAHPSRLITETLCTLYALALILPMIALLAWAVRGTPDDPKVSMILRSPTVLERYKRSHGIDPNNRREEILPLIKQAQLFAQYLNPAPAPSVGPAIHTVRSDVPTPSFSSITAKFILHGTCYDPSQPEASIALVWQPGGGGGTFQWIKQGARLGHFVVEEIKPGSITYVGGGQTHEMKVQHSPAKWNLVLERRTNPNRASNEQEALESVDSNGKHRLVKASKEEKETSK